VLSYVVSGRANKAIAEEMRIGEQAVKAHISRLFLKFRVENRAGLAVAAMSQEIDRRSLAARELEREIAFGKVTGIDPDGAKGPSLAEVLAAENAQRTEVSS